MKKKAKRNNTKLEPENKKQELDVNIDKVIGVPSIADQIFSFLSPSDLKNAVLVSR